MHLATKCKETTNYMPTGHSLNEKKMKGFAVNSKLLGLIKVIETNLVTLPSWLSPQQPGDLFGHLFWNNTYIIFTV